MENRYRKILFDEETWATLDILQMNMLFQNYLWVAFIKGKIIYVGEVFLQQGIRSTMPFSFESFFLECRKKQDLKDWLYVSKDLFSIYRMQTQYQMNCCFVNNGFNDCIDIACTHEVRNINDIQKIFK